MRCISRFLTVMLCYASVWAQSESGLQVDFRGQASLTGVYPVEAVMDERVLDLRYIPQLRLDHAMDGAGRLGFDFALDTYLRSRGGDPGTLQAEFYRFTIRYDDPQTQVRAGLQKINFGPGRMLRLLQWFDQLDPRDPLALSPGVWALMGRTYFQRGGNLRVWSMLDAPDAARAAVEPSEHKPLDVGGRLEYPIPEGTLGLTLHTMNINQTHYIQEQRLALDLRVDIIAGLWSEVVWTHSEDRISPDMLKTMYGMDYTLGVGNGLYLALEVLTGRYGDFFEASNDLLPIGNTYALMANYTLGLSDALTGYLYALSFAGMDTEYMPMLGWQHTMGDWMVYVALYDLPALLRSSGATGLPAGTGVQLNLAFNH